MALILFDLDGTVVVGYLSRPDKAYAPVDLLPGRKAVIRQLLDAGHRLGIVTNQGGVAFGLCSEADFFDKMEEVFAALEIEPEAMPVNVRYAHPKAKRAYYKQRAELARRKPSGRMISEQIVANSVDARGGVLFVGDSPDDQAAAQDAQVAFAWADAFFDYEYKIWLPPWPQNDTR